jgi:LysR family nitrogen assimilation transcriptional regulator
VHTGNQKSDIRFFYTKAVNLLQIEYFVRVAELGGFTRASVAVGISQPSLSRQVRLLEVELRQTLLHRNGRGIELTPAGRVLLEHGQAILQTVEQARDALNELRGDPRGKVVVGLPSRVAHLLTTYLVRAFRKEFPHAVITIAEGLSTALHEWLLLGNVDVALLFDPPRSADLELEALHDEQLVLVGPSGWRRNEARVPLCRIDRYPLILPRTPNSTRAVLEPAAARIGVKLQVAAEVDTIQNILELVARRIGYAVLPLGAVQHGGGEARFCVMRIHTPALHQRLFLAISRRRPRNLLATEVGRLIRAADLPRLLG